MCTAGQRVSLTITGPGPSFLLQKHRSLIVKYFINSYYSFIAQKALVYVSMDPKFDLIQKLEVVPEIWRRKGIFMHKVK